MRRSGNRRRASVAVGESQKPSRMAKTDAEGGRASPLGGESKFFLTYMDAQDKQDGRFLHEKPARAMIPFGLADALD